jgi:hypothetical protein
MKLSCMDGITLEQYMGMNPQINLVGLRDEIYSVRTLNGRQDTHKVIREHISFAFTLAIVCLNNYCSWKFLTAHLQRNFHHLDSVLTVLQVSV